MATRYRAEFHNINNVLWKIDVDDSSYTGAVTDIKINNFSLDYSQDGKMRVPPIKTSRVSFPIYVDETNLTEIEGFISDLMGAAEERFTVRVYRNTVFFWAGYVQTEISSIEETLPFYFTVSATDGLARLKNIEYKQASGEPYYLATFKDHILNCLNKGGLASLYWGATEGVFLRTAVDWWHEGHSTTSLAKDPVALSRFDGQVFARRNKNGTYVFQSCYEVLEKIATIWHATLYASQGGYRFEQPDYRINNDFNERRYTRTGSSAGNALTNLDRSLPQDITGSKMAGTSYDFFAPLRRVEVLYEHKTNRNWSAALAPIFGTGQAGGERDLGQIPFDTSTWFLISGRIRLKAVTSATVPWYYYANLSVRIGASTYIVQTASAIPGVFSVAYSNPAWGGVGGVAQVTTGFVWGTTFDGTFDFVITTPAIPSGTSGNVFIQLQGVGALDANANIVSLTTHTWQCEDLVLQVKNNDSNDNLEEERKYFWDGASTNSEKLELAVPFGAAIQPWTPGKIQVSPDGSTWVDTTAGWYAGGTTGVNNPIGELLARRIVAGQNSPVKRMHGTILGQNNYIHNLYSDIENFKWLPLGATFNAKLDEWDGEFRGLKYEPSGSGGHYVPLDDDEEVPFPPLPPIEGGKVVANNQIKGDLVPLLAGFFSAAMTSSAISGTITSVPVSVALQAGAFTAGDKIRVLNPLTKAVVELTVSTTNAAGATSIAVNSTTLSQSFPSFSYITKNIVAAGGSPGVSGSPFVQGGNSFGATGTIGTNDTQALNIETNNVARIGIASDGKVLIGGAHNAVTLTEKLQLLSGWLLLSNGYGLKISDNAANVVEALKITSDTNALTLTTPNGGEIKFFAMPAGVGAPVDLGGYQLFGTDYYFGASALSTVEVWLGDIASAIQPAKLGGMSFDGTNIYNGYPTIGDGTFVFPLSIGDTIERQVLDRNTSWTTGVAAAFIGITERRNGMVLKYIHFACDTFGSGSGNNTIETRKNGSAIGSTVTLNTAFQTLTLSETVATGDRITFNISAVRSTAAKGLTVELVFVRA